MTHFVRNGSFDHGNVYDALARLLDGFPNRLRNFARFADCEADFALAVPDHDECAEAKAFAALDDLGDTVNANHGFFESAGIALSASVLHQNVNPASRAASASARTRP